MESMEKNSSLIEKKFRWTTNKTTFGFAKKFFFSQVRRYNAREKFGRKVARFSSSEC